MKRLSTPPAGSWLLPRTLRRRPRTPLMPPARQPRQKPGWKAICLLFRMESLRQKPKRKSWNRILFSFSRGRRPLMKEEKRWKNRRLFLFPAQQEIAAQEEKLAPAQQEIAENEKTIQASEEELEEGPFAPPSGGRRK